MLRNNLDCAMKRDGCEMAVKNLMNNIIKATIIKSKYKGEDVLIKRLQSLLRLDFALTINKSEGSLEVFKST